MNMRSLKVSPLCKVIHLMSQAGAFEPSLDFEDGLRRLFEDVFAAPIKRYSAVSKEPERLDSLNISGEIKAVADSSQRPVAAILEEALPFCEKTSLLGKLKDSLIDNPNKLQIDLLFQTLEVFCDIFEEHWDLFSHQEKEKIKEAFSVLTSPSPTEGHTKIKSFKPISNFLGKYFVTSEVFSNIKSIFRLMIKDRDLYLDKAFYLFSRFNYIVEGIILNQEVRYSLSEVLKAWFNKYSNLDVLIPKDIAINIVNDYSDLPYPKQVTEELLDKYDSLKTDKDLYKVLAFYYKNKLWSDLDKEGQIEKNKAALKLIDSWRSERIDESEREKRKEDFEYLKRIVDSNRAPGQGVFSS